MTDAPKSDADKDEIETLLRLARLVAVLRTQLGWALGWIKSYGDRAKLVDFPRLEAPGEIRLNRLNRWKLEKLGGAFRNLVEVIQTVSELIFGWDHPMRDIAEIRITLVGLLMKKLSMRQVQDMLYDRFQNMDRERIQALVNKKVEYILTGFMSVNIDRVGRVIIVEIVQGRWSSTSRSTTRSRSSQGPMRNGNILFLTSWWP